MFNNSIKINKNAIVILAIMTVISLNGIIINHAYSISKGDQNYKVGYSDGCQDRQSGAGNGPSSNLMQTGGPHKHTQSYLTGWQDGYDNCF